MFAFMFGLTCGVVSTYFVMRFKNALGIFVKKTEQKIEENLTK